MSGIADTLSQLGVSLAVIAPGEPEQARAFRAEQGVTVPLFVDPGLRAFGALSLTRSIGATLGPASLVGAVRAFAKGFRPGPIQGDPWQQGGVVLMRPDGSVSYRYASRASGDHPTPGALLEAARQAVGKP